MPLWPRAGPNTWWLFCLLHSYILYAYVFCHCVVFLWRSKSRLVNSRYIVETQENDQKLSRFVETAFSAHFIPWVSFDAWHSFLQVCDVASLMFWITIFSVQFIMICTELRRITHSQIELRQSTILFGRVLFLRVLVNNRISSLFISRVTRFFRW